MSKPLPLLCQCRDHQRAPYSICCPGLLSYPAQLWFPIPVRDQREVAYDFLCFDCLMSLSDSTDTLEELIDVMHQEVRDGQLAIICAECLRDKQADVFVGPLMIAASARWVLKHFGKDAEAAAISIEDATTADDDYCNTYLGSASDEEVDDDVT